jgi:hypothetical protein
LPRDTARYFDREAADVPPAHAALSGVQSGLHLDSQSSGVMGEAGRASNRTRGAIEGREYHAAIRRELSALERPHLPTDMVLKALPNS